MKYEVKGGNLPVLLVNLEAGETIECEAGAMSWMDEGIEMQTQGGGIGKMFGRILTNENAFVNHYTARVPGEIATLHFIFHFFAPPFHVPAVFSRSFAAKLFCLIYKTLILKGHRRYPDTPQEHPL